MSSLVRKCYLYAHAQQEGFDVNWTTGEIREKKS